MEILCYIEGRKVTATVIESCLDGDFRVSYMGRVYIVQEAA